MKMPKVNPAHKMKITGYTADAILFSSLYLFHKTQNESFENFIVFIAVLLFSIHIISVILAKYISERMSIEDKINHCKLDHIEEHNIIEYIYHALGDAIVVISCVYFGWFVIGVIFFFTSGLARQTRGIVFDIKEEISCFNRREN